MAFTDYSRSILKNNKMLRDNMRRRHFNRKFTYTKSYEYLNNENNETLIQPDYKDGNSIVQIVQKDYPWIIIILVVFVYILMTIN